MCTSPKSFIIAAVAALCFTGAAHAADPVKISGTGATFPGPLYAKWIEAYNKDHPDVKLDYSAIGSGAGIYGITDRTVNFGASDAPMTDCQEKAAPAHLLHLPTVAGPVVMIYNLPLPKLNLNGDIIADIYLKQITRPGTTPKSPPSTPASNCPTCPSSSPTAPTAPARPSSSPIISPRSVADWTIKVGKGTAVQWPVGLGGKGNDGVAAAVKIHPGSIGYVEFAYATKKLPFANHDQ